MISAEFRILVLGYIVVLGKDILLQGVKIIFFASWVYATLLILLLLFNLLFNHCFILDIFLLCLYFNMIWFM